MSTHVHTSACTAILRELRQIRQEASEERKETLAKIDRVAHDVVGLKVDVSALKERTEGVPKMKEKVAALNVKTTLLGVAGGGGVHALLRLLGR